MMTQRIPIHWLHSQAYCEYQIQLEKVEGIEPEVSEAVQQGIAAHAALEEAHMAEAELELTIADALTKAQSEGVALRAREVHVEGKSLIGCIDEVVFIPDRILIVDDKPGDIPYLGNKRQVWGYCLAFEEEFKPQLPLVAVLRNRDTGKEVWEEAFSDEHRRDVLIAVERIWGILSGKRAAEPTPNPNKCRPCRLRDHCPVRSG